MGVRMERHGLPPGLKVDRTTKAGVKFGPTYVNDGLTRRLEQGPIEHLRTMLGENIQILRSGEDYVQVPNWKDLLPARLKPCLPRLAPTRRTATVAARAIQPILSVTLVAPLCYRSHPLRSAGHDVIDRLALIGGETSRLHVLPDLPSHNVSKIDHRPRLPRSSGVLRGSRARP